MQALHLGGGGRRIREDKGALSPVIGGRRIREDEGALPLTGVMILESNRLMGGTWMVPPASDIISRRTSSSEG